MLAKYGLEEHKDKDLNSDFATLTLGVANMLAQELSATFFLITSTTAGSASVLRSPS